MAHELATVSDLIDLWHTTAIGRKRRANIALGADLKIPASAVRSMRHRNSIAKKYWLDLLEAARKHAEDPEASPLFSRVSAQLLVDLSASHESPNRDSVRTNLPTLAA